MKTVLLLAEFETSRYSPYLIGTKKSNYKMIVLGMLLFLAANLLLMRNFESAAGLIMINTVITLEALMILMVVEYMGFTKHHERDWWLLLPHSRMKLVFGKALGYVKIGCHLFVYLTLIRLIHYTLSVGWLGMEAVGMVELLQLIGANALMLMACLPVLIGIGLLLITFQVWWARIVIVLLTFYTIMPVIVFLFLAGIADFAEANLNASQMVYYAAITASIAWPVAALCLWLAGKVGMKHLGALKFKTGWNWQTLLNGQSTPSDPVRVQRDVRRSPFRTLVALERKRYGVLTGSRIGKIGAVVLSAVVGTISYSSSDELMEYVSFMSLIHVFGFMIIVIYYNNLLGVFQRSIAGWWIALPHSRFVLASSKAAAYLSVMMPYWAMLVGSGVAGAIVRQWLDPMPQEHWFAAGQYTAYYLILYFPLAFLYVFALQAAPAFLKRSWIIVFSIPLYAGYILSIQMSGKMIIPDRRTGLRIEDGPDPNFVWKALSLYGFAIPLALFCFWLGVKYMNNYSMVRESARVRKINKL